MRHLNKGRNLDRNASHRRAMLRNLATSVLAHHQVETTHEKALEVRRVVERLITYGKRGDLHARRMAARVVMDSGVLKKLFLDLAPKFQDRKGGYTRVIKKGFRRGDSAAVSIIQLVGMSKAVSGAPDPGKKEKAASVPEAVRQSK